MLIAGVVVAALAVLTNRSMRPSHAIAFVYEEKGEFGIYTMDPDGGHRTRLVVTQSTPAWLIEARQLAPFGLQALSAVPIVERQSLLDPVWLSSGHQISYSLRTFGRQSGSNCDQVISVGLQDKNPQSVTCLRWGYRDEARDWSPDGRFFAFADREPIEFSVKVLYSLENKTRQFITHGRVWGLAWSPDSARLAVTVDEEPSIQIFAQDGSVQALESGAPAFGKPTWSPDGTVVAYLCYVEERIEICMMDTNGAAFSRISFPAGFPYIKKDIHWSPADDWIVFEAVQGGGYNDLFVVSPNDGEWRQLTFHPAGDSEPTWSPDGLKVAFISMRDGNREIYTINADGTALTRVTDTPGDEGSPTWRP